MCVALGCLCALAVSWTESYLGGGRIRQSSGEYSPEYEGAYVTCDTCRARMCTDGLLSKLRCAECRQIKVDQFRDVAVKASLLALGGFFLWSIFFRRTASEDPAEQEASVHTADLTSVLHATRRRA